MTDWNPVLPASQVWIAVTLLVLLVLLAAWRTRRSWPVWANLSSIGLRMIVLACAVVLVLRPESVRKEKHEHHPPLLVLVDGSQSLRLRDGNAPKTRAEAGQAALTALLARAQERDWALEAFHVGSKLEPRHASDGSIRAQAPESPLGELLAAAMERATASAEAKAPGAVIFFTDGCVNRGRPLAQAATLLAQRGTPLFAVALGEDHPLPADAVLEDLVIRRENEDERPAEAPRAGERLSIEARGYLRAGSPDLSGPLADTLARLQIAGPPEGVAPTSGALPSAGGFIETDALRHRLRLEPAWTAVKLRFTAKTPGLYRVRLALDPLHGERQRANNAAYGSVEVQPPRRRVLFAASRLGHDYRKLKTLFTSWDGPVTDVLADFVTPEGGREREWSIESALSRQLDESVTPAARAGTLVWDEPDVSHLTSRTQARLRAALEAGELGVVWILNEPLAQFAKRLRNTPLEDVVLFKNFAGGAELVGPQPVSSCAAARDHPVTRFAFGDGVGADPFQMLGATQVCGPLAGPRAETQVLLSAGAAPLLAVGQVGKGRVAVLACGESWRWLTPSKHSYEACDALAASLWRRLVDWISGSTSRDDLPVRIFLPKDRWECGETLNARVAVKAPAPGESVRVQYALNVLPEEGVAPPKPEWQSFASDTGISTHTSGAGREALRVLSGPAGKPQASGEWLLRMRALRPGGEEIGADAVQFAILGSSLEERDVRPAFEALESSVQAAAPGGRVVRPVKEDIEKLLLELEPRMRGEVIESEERRPAISPVLLLALLVVALVVDVWLRRG